MPNRIADDAAEVAAQQIAEGEKRSRRGRRGSGGRAPPPSSATPRPKRENAPTTGDQRRPAAPRPAARRRARRPRPAQGRDERHHRRRWRRSGSTRPPSSCSPSRTPTTRPRRGPLARRRGPGRHRARRRDHRRAPLGLTHRARTGPRTRPKRDRGADSGPAGARAVWIIRQDRDDASITSTRDEGEERNLSRSVLRLLYDSDGPMTSPCRRFLSDMSVTVPPDHPPRRSRGSCRPASPFSRVCRPASPSSRVCRPSSPSSRVCRPSRALPERELVGVLQITAHGQAAGDPASPAPPSASGTSPATRPWPRPRGWGWWRRSPPRCPRRPPG